MLLTHPRTFYPELDTIIMAIAESIGWLLVGWSRETVFSGHTYISYPPSYSMYPRLCLSTGERSDCLHQFKGRVEKCKFCSALMPSLLDAWKVFKFSLVASASNSITQISMHRSILCLDRVRDFSGRVPPSQRHAEKGLTWEECSNLHRTG